MDHVFYDFMCFMNLLLFALLLMNTQNLTGCGCVSAEIAKATAIPGKCPTPGCQEAFLIFLCVICACSLVGAMAQTPSVIILIRYFVTIDTFLIVQYSALKSNKESNIFSLLLLKNCES